jgi:hypothetical protein
MNCFFEDQHRSLWTLSQSATGDLLFGKINVMLDGVYPSTRKAYAPAAVKASDSQFHKGRSLLVLL